MNCLAEFGSWMGVRVWWHVECDRGIGGVAILESLWQGQSALLWCNQDSTSSRTNTSSLARPLPIFICWVGHSNTYFFLLPPTQCLMSSWQNQFVLDIVGWVVFLLHTLVAWAWVPCLLAPTLILHKVPILACIAQHLLTKLCGNLAMCL